MDYSIKQTYRFPGGGGKQEGRNISKSISEHSLEIFCHQNDAKGNYSLGSFGIYSNLNSLISKACGSYSSKHCRKNKEPIFIQKVLGCEGGRHKTRKTTCSFKDQFDYISTDYYLIYRNKSTLKILCFAKQTTL